MRAPAPETLSRPTPGEGTVADVERCVSCGRPAGTPYCPHCGERRAADRRYSLPHFFREVAEAFTNADNTVVRTLSTLVSRPGELTAAYMRGERVRYMRPLQLFLLVNVAFFLVASWGEGHVFDTPLGTHMTTTVHRETASRLVRARLAERGIPLDQYRAAFDNASSAQAKSLVILMIPMFAAAVAVVSVRRRRFTVQHLVFSVHTFAMLLILIPAVGLPVEAGLRAWARWRGVPLGWQVVDQTVSTALLVAFGTYVALALRRAYGDGRAGAAAKAVVLCVALGAVLFVYRFVLFFTTFWST